MNKIVLDLDTLAVDSFVAGDGMNTARGTVDGHLLVNTRAHSCARTACCPDTTLC